MTPDKTELFLKLKELGEKQVRENLNQGLYSGKNKINLISEWLRQQSGLKEESRFSRIEEREEESLAVAREANEIASSARDAAFDANRIASSALEKSEESNKLAFRATKSAHSAIIIAIIAAIGTIILAICAIISIFK